jgi:glucosamine-6-phosphate deaminase
LGIGTDGHVGFNEPGSSLASHTRLKTLMGQTRADNARFFAGDIDAVPHHCLTQGLGTIMAARHIFLIATGRAKAEAVHQHHRHVTVLIDNAAASSATTSAARTPRNRSGRGSDLSPARSAAQNRQRLEGFG